MIFIIYTSCPTALSTQNNFRQIQLVHKVHSPSFTSVCLMTCFLEVFSIRMLTFLLLSFTCRNLAKNGIQHWEDGFSIYLPSLASLDITGNEVIPYGHVLGLSTLNEIKGVTWGGGCTNCVLLRNVSRHGDGHHGDSHYGDITVEDLKEGEFVRGLKGDCRADRYSVKNTTITFAKHGFLPLCVVQQEKCFRSEISVTPIHRCWETDNYILNIEFLIAPVALLLNAVVFVTIFSIRSLRSNVSMLLIANMAVSDFLISGYSVAITSARKLSYVKFLTVMSDFCQVWGFIWLLGQFVTVTTSLQLTLERYWAVVYCMKPKKRMKPRRATAAIIFCWLMAVALAILPLAGVGVYTSNTYCIPIRPRRDIPRVFEFSIALTLSGISLYFITVPFYIKIYLFVRRSSNRRVGLSREGALAKRIAILVISNMLFFLFPIVLALLWLLSDALQELSPVFEEILTGVVPTICFSINSCINPLLSAFYQQRFRRKLLERLTACRQRTRACSLSSIPPHSTEHNSDTKQDKGVKSLERIKRERLLVEERLTHL